MNDKIVIGKVGAARGLYGEVKIIPLTDFNDRFDNLSHVFIDDQTIKINSVKYIGKNLILIFDGFDSREKVQKLTGKLLTVDKSDAAPLAEGEFYTFDIVGLSVFDLVNNKIGVVTHVLKTGSNDVFVVKSDDNREILIPALKRVVKNIDLHNKLMSVDMKALEVV